MRHTFKRIALIAHDNKKPDLAEWALFNREFLAAHELVATGTTGMVLEEQLGLKVVRVRSGPLGGDQQIGAMIAEGASTCSCSSPTLCNPCLMILTSRHCYAWAMVWNIPVACNRASADFIVSSSLMSGTYQPFLPSYCSTGEVPVL